MPELPEVTTTVAGLNKVLPHKKITDVWSDYFIRSKNKQRKTIKNKLYASYFRKEVSGEKVKDVERRGKNILIHLTHGKTILIHMKMTGHLLYGRYTFKNGIWKSDDQFLKDPFNQFIHLVFTLSDKHHLAFSDMRKFAKVFVFETDKRHELIDLKELGPEPLEHLSLQTLKTQLSKKPLGKIKAVLLDQTILAGIGNIYSDEILWEAGIHPERKVKDISDMEMKKMWQAMKKILTTSIKLGGDSMSDYRNIYGKPGQFQNSHKVYRKTKERCSKKGCSGIIERKIIGGRSAHFCPTHQI